MSKDGDPFPSLNEVSDGDTTVPIIRSTDVDYIVPTEWPGPYPRMETDEVLFDSNCLDERASVKMLTL
jgi:hypothetical protein